MALLVALTTLGQPKKPATLPGPGRFFYDYQNNGSYSSFLLTLFSRRRQARRSRKYSEVLSVGGSSMSLARSYSMAYPHFMGPSVASSYR